VHLALKPTPIHIGRWRPEPSQNLRHLAARKARPGRRAALGLIHHHRHNHHPFAAACAHGGSLRLATRDYRQQQTHALRSLLVEGQHNEALAAPAVDTLASAPRHPAAIATSSARAGAWSCSRPLSMEGVAQTALVSGRCRRQPRAGRLP
jgi:hypothetical protein